MAHRYNARPPGCWIGLASTGCIRRANPSGLPFAENPRRRNDMSDSFETSRRDFLSASAKAAALAGLAAGSFPAGCAETTEAARVERPTALAAPRGPRPAVVKPDQKIRIGLIGVGGRGSAHLKIALERQD